MPGVIPSTKMKKRRTQLLPTGMFGVEHQSAARERLRCSKAVTPVWIREASAQSSPSHLSSQSEPCRKTDFAQWGMKSKKHPAVFINMGNN